jgi:hypothetical protein
LIDQAEADFRHAPQEEQEGQSHDEAREARPDHDEADQPSECESHGQRDEEGRRRGRRAQPERQPPFQHHSHGHSGEADHRADGEVELARDHQEARPGGDDAELRDDREIVLQAEGIEGDPIAGDRDCGDHHNHHEEGADFRPPQQHAQAAALVESVGFLSPEGDWVGLRHGPSPTEEKGTAWITGCPQLRFSSG